MAQESLIAFISYVRLDDQHENGRISEIRKQLSSEVRMQTGQDFPIFQDRQDIQWGQKWRERIEGSIDSVTFFIPVVTPGFFLSGACRGELQQFIDREESLGRSDLILPIYYVDCPLLNDPERRAADPLAEVIYGHQYVDWRPLRFEPETSLLVRKMVAQMAIQVRDSLDRMPAPLSETPGQRGRQSVSSRMPGNSQGSTGEPQPATESAGETSPGPSTVTEPPTRVVDPMGRGDHRTITDAIGAATPGDRVLVRPGLYHEALVLDKPLEIIGDGEVSEIVVQSSNGNCLSFETNMGRVVNLTLRQIGGDGHYCVNISQGRLILEDCDITSRSLACVGIHNWADPRLLRNRIHDGAQGGVYVYENGLGTLEDNDIFGNRLAGVGIKSGANPTLRRNRIHDGVQGGVYVYENGQGTLEDNDIFGNGRAGVAIKEGANPTLRRNRIHDGVQGGVYVYENGLGTLEDNDIFGNGRAGVAIKSGANPTLRRNRIHDGIQAGVFVYENGLGTLEDNDIFGNGNTGVRIRKGANPTLRRNRIYGNSYEAIWISDEGGGTIEDNDLRNNTRGAWDISEDSEPLVHRANNQE